MKICYDQGFNDIEVVTATKCPQPKFLHATLLGIKYSLRFRLLDCPFFTAFLTIKRSPQNTSITLLQIPLKLHEHRGGYWRKKLPSTILKEQFPGASFRCYDIFDIIVTLVITNFYLYLIQLWWKFFQMFVYGDMGYAQTWEVLTLKNCIELLSKANQQLCTWILVFFLQFLPSLHNLDVKIPNFTF